MADTTEETTPATGETTPAPEAEQTTPPAPEAAAQNPDAVKAALKAERDAAKAAKAAEKAAREALAAAQEEKTSTLAQLDELKAKVTAAEGATAPLQAKLDRYEVAAEAGLDLALAVRLNGATREELVADAAALKQLVGTSAAPAVDLDGGARQTPPAKGTPEQEHSRLLAQLFSGGDVDED